MFPRDVRRRRGKLRACRRVHVIRVRARVSARSRRTSRRKATLLPTPSHEHARFYRQLHVDRIETIDSPARVASPSILLTLPSSHTFQFFFPFFLSFFFLTFNDDRVRATSRPAHTTRRLTPPEIDGYRDLASPNLNFKKGRLICNVISRRNLV